ncbi:MAG: ParB/RepB/Spo0J family partition protein [Oscillospiraceae bacterium]|nr:ParB/RepB/Spo0J family partition protein [Oscillospiraceae bacterium]
MVFPRQPNLLESQKVNYLKLGLIRPNPHQPRRRFDLDDLRELADSITQYGILQPLTVRRASDGGYELVAGERRLRAARMAGLPHVPCLLVNIDAEQSSLIALVENLQRRDLDFFEEAEGLENLIRIYGLSQEEAARRVGISQSAVANKLRLLRHPPEIIALIRQHNLTERHARALLRLEEYGDRMEALDRIIQQRLNVAQSERYIESVLARRGGLSAQKARARYVLKDVRLFLNTVGHAVDIMRQAGVPAGLDRQDSDREIVVTIKIPRITVVK